MRSMTSLEVLLGNLTVRFRELIGSMRQIRHGGSIILVLTVALGMTMLPAVASAQWTQVGADIDGEWPSDQSGKSMAYSSDGSRVVIGAVFNDDNGAGSGQVRVYQSLNSSWDQIGQDINGEEHSSSGRSVAISPDGSRIAVGAPLYGPDNYGSVRVYSYISSPFSSWLQVGSDLDGEAAFDLAGFSVALSGDGTRVAIGAPYSDETDADSGHVRVYRRNGDNWEQVGFDVGGEGREDHFGYAVALSLDGRRLAVGAPGNDDNGVDSGHVRVFRWSSSSQIWSRVGSDIDGEAAGDESGSSVSLSSDGLRLAIGAPNNHANGAGSGHVRVYGWDGVSWIRMEPDIDGEAVGDQSGVSVGLSPDGSRLAVGAPGYDGIGSESGRVRVYEFIPWPVDRWLQIGSDLGGESPGDLSGTSVALSSTGFRVAIGAPQNDDNGDDSGHVRVYEMGLFSDGFETGNTGFWDTTVP